MYPAPVGLLLLSAAVVVVISTGMNYLFSPSTNIIRDILPVVSKKASRFKKTCSSAKDFDSSSWCSCFLMIFIPNI